MKTCVHWQELDDDQGIFEFCRAAMKRTVCCGCEKQCIFNDKYEEPPCSTA